ncbi:MAG: hypothetical protein Q9M39_05780 [Sulfurovum sp.]|nr:hypothetical protein [Sulfurovum sp.]
MMKKGLAFCLPKQDDEEICFRDIRGRWAVLYYAIEKLSES